MKKQIWKCKGRPGNKFNCRNKIYKNDPKAAEWSTGIESAVMCPSCDELWNSPSMAKYWRDK